MNVITFASKRIWMHRNDIHKKALLDKTLLFHVP